MPAPDGNKNAAKPAGERLDSILAVRVTRARKGAYVRAARPRRLSDWVTHHLDRAAGFKDKGTP